MFRDRNARHRPFGSISMIPKSLPSRKRGLETFRTRSCDPNYSMIPKSCRLFG
jgi:hypothetical protein